MALSNTAVPKYYGMFRDAVVQGLIPINQEIELQMNRIDALIADPMYYYDDKVVDGFYRLLRGRIDADGWIRFTSAGQFQALGGGHLRLVLLC